MNKEVLVNRLQDLKQDLDKQKNIVKELNEKLQEANAFLMTIHGHCNEVTHLLSEYEKAEAQIDTDDTHID